MTSAAPDGAGTTPATGWYVFGVVRHPQRPAQVPADVEMVWHHRLAAMVQQVPLAEFSRDVAAVEGPDDLAWLEGYARRHDHVLNAAMATTGVLPLRFGTVVAHRVEVRTLLARHERAFAGWLDELGDRAEYTVKAWVDAAALNAQDDRTQSASATTGTAYLQQRQAQRQQAEQRRQSLAELVDEVHRRLGAVVEVATTVPGRSDAPAPRPAHHGAYLAAPSQRDALTAETDALASEYAHCGLQLDLTGPWPAHHFLPDSWTAAEADANQAANLA